MQHLQRQLIDLQNQAEKLTQNTPSTVEIENYGKYVEEVKTFIADNVDMPEVRAILAEIPFIAPFQVTVRSGLAAFLIPGFMFAWFAERRYVAEAQEKVRTCRGKFASVAFLVRHYF